MGREVRKVPEGYEHPKDERGKFISLLDGYEDALDGFQKYIHEHGLAAAIDYFGGGPQSDDYMLVGVPKEQRTHFMMFQNVSEGTPISPAFATPEELARWLTENGANAGAGMTANYQQWLRVCKGGYAPSMVISNGVLQSGVAAM